MIQAMIDHANEDIERAQQAISAAMERRDHAIQLKAYFQAWGAQDKKVTAEWA